MLLPFTWRAPDAAKLMQFYRYEVARHCMGFDEHGVKGRYFVDADIEI